jgi:methionyl-tRNA formyltransferase
MKTIITYCRRNVGMAILPFLVAKGYGVKVISDDETVLWMADSLGLEIVTLDSMGEFDLFLCVHGNKIIDKKYLVDKKFVNVHPCLYKYKGHNPIRRYILGKDTDGTVESHFMTEVVDEGEVIIEVGFETPICKTYADFYNVALKHYFFVIDKTLEALDI